MEFTLSLIRDAKGNLLLEGRRYGEELEYYDVDGEGGKATKISFAPWNQEVEVVEGVLVAYYYTDDSDSFWAALEIVLQSALDKEVELPPYHALNE